MKLESEDIIDQPLAVVYKTVRDDLESLVPYLPNVAKIQQESSETSDGVTKITNRWYAKAELPSLLKKVLKPEFLSWIDKATWHDNHHRVDYVLESPIGSQLFDAKGSNAFEATADGKTKLRITCEVQLFPENVPGVPKFLAKKVTPAVEALLKKMLEPNLTALATGLKGYYSQG